MSNTAILVNGALSLTQMLLQYQTALGLAAAENRQPTDEEVNAILSQTDLVIQQLKNTPAPSA